MTIPLLSIILAKQKLEKPGMEPQLDWQWPLELID